MGAAESGQRRAAQLRAAAAAMDSVDPQAAEQRRSRAERIEKGNEGEQRVGAVLNVLDGAGWVVLHDRYKSARSPANLDHVVVGPPGVFVVDAKNWTGAQLRLDERGLALDGRRRDRALDAARADADLVGQLVATVVPGVAPVGVLAFVQDIGLTGPVLHQQVTVLQAEQLLSWLTSQPPRLTAQHIHQVASTLDAALPARAGRRTPFTVQPALGDRPAGKVAPAGSRRRPTRQHQPTSLPARRPVSQRQPVPHNRPVRRFRATQTVCVLVLLAVLLLGGLPLLLQAWTSLLTELLQQIATRSVPGH